MNRLKKNKISTIVMLSFVAVVIMICLIIAIVIQVKTNNLTEAEFANLPTDYYSWALLSNWRGVETLKDYKLIANGLSMFIYCSLACCSLAIFNTALNCLIITSPIERDKYNYLETSILEMNKPEVDLNVIKTKIQNDFESNIIGMKTYSLLIDMVDLKLELKNNISESEK